MVHDLVETPLERLCVVFMHDAFPSLGSDMVLPNCLDHSHTSHIYSQTSPSLQYDLDVPIDNHIICDASVDLSFVNNMFNMLGEKFDGYVSLNYFRGYDPSIVPYCLYQGELFRKVMWTIFFDPSIHPYCLVRSCLLYLTFYFMWSQESGKFLCALMLCDLKSHVLSSRWAG